MGFHPIPGLSPSAPTRAAERRRHRRQGIIEQELVTIKLGENGGLLLDLSSGGAAVQSVAPLESGAEAPFSFQLPDSNSQIVGDGVFVWVDETKLAGGLRFDRLSPQAQQLLEQWMEGVPSAGDAAPPDGDRGPFPGSSLSGAPAAETAATDVTTSLCTQYPAVAAGLARMAERARIVTGASGACIALKDDQGNFVCEASVGTAPDLGIPVNLERGLAAECVAREELVVCDEARNDARVDGATRQQLSLGSAALLPLFDGHNLLGVIGVFSDRPRAFREQAIARLHDCARTVETAVLRGMRGEVKPAPPPAPAPATALPAARAVALPKRRDSETSLAASILRTLTAAILGCAILLGGFQLYQRRTLSSVPPVTNLQFQPTPPPHVAHENPPVSAPESSSQPVTVQTAMPGAMALLEHRSEPVADVVTKAPAAGHEAKAALRSPQTSVPPERLQMPTPAPSTEVVRQTPPVAAPHADNVPAPPPSPAAQNEAEAHQVAPAAVSAGVAAKPGLIPRVDVFTSILETRPKERTSASQLPAPVLISKSELHYPAAAIALSRQGSVVLRVTVGRTGVVDSIQVLDGDPLLTAQAESTVHQWRYQPYKMAGHEVAVDLLVTVNFVLASQE